MKLLSNLFLLQNKPAAYYNRMCVCQILLSNRNFSSSTPPSTKQPDTRPVRPRQTPSSSGKLNVMFFGTDLFALESLKKLYSGQQTVINHLEVCCISSSASPVSRYAEKNGLNMHLYPPKIDSGQFDLGVVASFGKLISSAVISKFDRGVLNVHGSLLPKLRGAAPIIHALRMGMTETGITIMKIKPKKFDVGDLLAQQRVDIPPDILRSQLTHNMAVVGANLMWEVVQDLDRYEANCVQQDDRQATLAPAIDKSIAFLDFQSQTNIEIYNLWRSVHDVVKLRSRWKSTNASVRFGRVLPPSSLDSFQLETRHPGSPAGQAVYLKPGKGRHFLCIKCRQGWIAVDEINFPNKTAMSPVQFYNGYLNRPDQSQTMFVKDG